MAFSLFIEEALSSCQKLPGELIEFIIIQPGRVMVCDVCTNFLAKGGDDGFDIFGPDMINQCFNVQTILVNFKIPLTCLSTRAGATGLWETFKSLK